MKYFKLIKNHVDVRWLLDEIQRYPDPWSMNTGRQSKIEVQRESHSIPLRGLVKSEIGDGKRRNVHESRFTTTSRSFTEAIGFITTFAAERNAELGRAKLVKLGPGCRVYPHIDRGEYYRLRDRYHLVLRSANGSYLKSGDEAVRMKEGELWWFDNKQVHSAYNDSDEDRIHLIFDLLPAAVDRATDDAGSRRVEVMAS
ncbi:MAG: aspartyl/asparaginyl beta-hydroxylase domain-containing protein [Acidiferrobacterales bacterium]